MEVERHGATVMPPLKPSQAVFHVTNALQSRVDASLPGLLAPLMALYLLISFTCGGYASVVLHVITVHTKPPWVRVRK